MTNASLEVLLAWATASGARLHADITVDAATRSLLATRPVAAVEAAPGRPFEAAANLHKYMVQST